MHYTKTAIMCGCLFAAGCGGSGPTSRSILEGTNFVLAERKTRSQAADQAPYLLVEVSRNIAQNFTATRHWLERQSFYAPGSPYPVTIGQGDVVDVAIISTSDTGFVDFTNASIAPISQTSLVPQQVGVDGMIRVPPLGRVRAAGQTTGQVESFLTSRLGEVLVEPAAIVTIADRRSAKVAVVGEVSAPGKYSISDTDMRLLDMFSLAGGSTERSENLQVRLSRGGATRETSLEAVLSDPRLNVYMRPDDVLEVETPEKRVVILGSGGNTNSTVTFEYPDSTLANVLGEAGGLANRTADRSGVFLYREVQPDLLARFGVATSGFSGPTVPVVFQFDLSEPSSLFAAKAFEVQDGDVLYLSTSVRDAFEALSTFVPLPADFVRDQADLNR